MFREMGTSCREAGRRRSIASGDRGAVILDRSRRDTRRGVFFFGEESVSLFRVTSGYLGSGLEAALLLLLLLQPAEARPCSRPVCSAGPPTGDPKNPPAGRLLLRRSTRPGRRPPDPLSRGLFAPRSRFKKGRFVRLLVRVGGLGVASCHQCH